MMNTDLNAASQDITDLPAAEAQILTEAARRNGFSVFELDGARMKDKAALMDHAALALGFPGDFGRNWDAMVDYLGDMSNIHGNGKILVLINNSGAIGGSEGTLARDLRKVCTLACENAREWSKCTILLKFVFIT